MFDFYSIQLTFMLLLLAMLVLLVGIVESKRLSYELGINMPGRFYSSCVIAVMIIAAPLLWAVSNLWFIPLLTQYLR